MQRCYDCVSASSSVGEIIVARANRAQLILTFQEKLSLAIEGTLVCTNYRVSFVPDKQVLSKVGTVSCTCVCVCACVVGRGRGETLSTCLAFFLVFSYKTDACVGELRSTSSSYVICANLNVFGD